jgi:hypothetical protein
MAQGYVAAIGGTYQAHVCSESFHQGSISGAYSPNGISGKPGGEAEVGDDVLVFLVQAAVGRGPCAAGRELILIGRSTGGVATGMGADPTPPSFCMFTTRSYC